MSLIVLDTQILIWAVKREATPGQEPMIEKAARYLEHLDKCKDQMIIPSVVVSEFLANVPDERQAAVLKALENRFMVIPFDMLAAVEAARIWRINSSGNVPLVQQLKADGFKNAKIKVDLQIIGTALARKAARITTHDEGLIKNAWGHLEAGPMPDLPTQPELGLAPHRPRRYITGE
jgi:predicted nucleic acid-binding protein